MKVFITGVDGYIGWALAQYLTVRGHQVAGADNLFRRQWVTEMGSWSAIPIAPVEERVAAFRDVYGVDLPFWKGDLRDLDLVHRIFREFRPDAVVHLGECPSAPYSMIDIDHAKFVQMNNITTTFNLLDAIRTFDPAIHLIKLGSMGEYGTPNVDIPEGFFDVEFRGRHDRLPFPRQGFSWYHWSKVHGSNNIMFACKVWGLRSTDVMQGTVFGTRTEETMKDPRVLTRVDFDQAFGTVVNRFCCEAIIGHPLTAYGGGNQTRSFIALRDSMKCLTLALENPPTEPEYRVFNQFARLYQINDIARIVKDAAAAFGIEAEIAHFENPRNNEKDTHYFNPDHDCLRRLGYVSPRYMEDEVPLMIEDLLPYRDRIEAKRDVLLPDVRWDGTRSRIRQQELVAH